MPKSQERRHDTSRESKGSSARGRKNARARWLLPVIAVVLVIVGALFFSQTPLVQTGQAADSIPCETREQSAYHVHAHLSILVDGTAQTVPANIGIRTGSCLYWLHTHDVTGVIHVEAPTARGFTLGQFFDIWQQPLNANAVATSSGPVTAYVDGQRYDGDIRSIRLADHQSITLEVGKIVTPPQDYDFATHGL